MVTDTTEKGLEALICNSLTSNGWLPGDPQDYDLNKPRRPEQLVHVPTTTKPEPTVALSVDTDTPREGGALGQRLLTNPSEKREAIAMDLGPEQGPDKPAEARHQFRDRPTGLRG